MKRLWLLAATLTGAACFDFDRAYDERVAMLGGSGGGSAGGSGGGSAGGSAGGTAGGSAGGTAGGATGGSGGGTLPVDGGLTPLELVIGESGILYSTFGTPASPAAVGIDNNLVTRFGFFIDRPDGGWRTTNQDPVLGVGVTPYRAFGASATDYWVLDYDGYVTHLVSPSQYTSFARTCGFDAGTQNWALAEGRNTSEVLFGGASRHVCRFTASGTQTQLSPDVALDGGVIHALWLTSDDKIVTLESAPGVNASGAAVVALLDGGELIGTGAGLRVAANFLFEASHLAGVSSNDFWVLDGFDHVARYLDGGVTDVTPAFAESRWAMMVRPGNDVWLVGSRIRRYDGAAWNEVSVTLPGSASEYGWRSIREIAPGQLALGGRRVKADGGNAPVYLRVAVP